MKKFRLKKSTYLYFISLAAMAGVIFAQQTSTTTFVNPLPEDKIIFLEINEINTDSLKYLGFEIKPLADWLLKKDRDGNKTVKQLLYDVNLLNKKESFLLIAYGVIYAGIRRCSPRMAKGYIFDSLPIVFDLRRIKMIPTEEAQIRFVSAIKIEKVYSDGTVEGNYEGDYFKLSVGEKYSKKIEKIIELSKNGNIIEKMKRFEKNWEKGIREKVKFGTTIEIINHGIIDKKNIEKY
jgi:hypothetical protein